MGQSVKINFEKEFGNFSRELVFEAGEIIKKYYYQKLNVQYKQDASPVTIADRKAEEYIRKKIKKKFPHHGILGEEFGCEKLNSEFSWVIDPIDGTKSFISGVPLFTTLLALIYQKEPVYGVIYQPILNEMVWGDGKKSYFNGKRTQMRDIRHLKAATLLTTDLISIKEHQNLKNFLFLGEKVALLRTWGDGYGYMQLARGRADIMVDPIMNPWDIMALIPIIRGARGVITDYHGKDPTAGKSIVASNPFLHPQVMKILNEET